MNMETAKQFVLQLGALITLYLSLSFVLVLIFGIINLRFPDAAEGYWQIEQAGSSVRLGIAMVVVFFPAYLGFTRVVNKMRRQNTEQTYLPLTRWLIYLSLLVSGLILLGDLVVVINTFLEGEITVRFILKALAVLVVIGSAFYYYLLDAKDYWLTHEQQSVWCGVGAGLLVAAVVGVGFMHIETPAEVRERRLDEKQLTDLQDIQWRIYNHLEVQQELPADLAIIQAGAPLPVAAPERTPYRYEVTDTGFALCATFAYPSAVGDPYLTRPMMPSEEKLIKGMDDWTHGAGEVCFERTVTHKDTMPTTQ